MYIRPQYLSKKMQELLNWNLSFKFNLMTIWLILFCALKYQFLQQQKGLESNQYVSFEKYILCKMLRMQF